MWKVSRKFRLATLVPLKWVFLEFFLFFHENYIANPWYQFKFHRDSISFIDFLIMITEGSWWNYPLVRKVIHSDYSGTNSQKTCSQHLRWRHGSGMEFSVEYHRLFFIFFKTKQILNFMNIWELIMIARVFIYKSCLLIVSLHSLIKEELKHKSLLAMFGQLTQLWRNIDTILIDLQLHSLFD